MMSFPFWFAPLPFKFILFSHFTSLLKLSGFQMLDLLFHNFSGDALVFTLTLQVYYFFAEITEYWYRRILVSIPLNQNMIQTWQGVDLWAKSVKSILKKSA